MKLNIVCAFDAIFDINNQQYEMIKNASTIEMDLNDGESLLLKAYPISSKNLLPFAADLKNINGKFETKSWQVFVWKQDQESTDIEILPFEVKSFHLKKLKRKNLTT